MAYFERTGIYAADTPSIDAFGRWRVSQASTLFDSKLVATGSLENYWSFRSWGNATGSYRPWEAAFDLYTGIASGSRAVHQTKRHFVYEPGKSLLIIMTGVMNSGVAGVEKYMLYGDDYHGLGFCMSGSSFGVVKRDTKAAGNTVTTFVSQSDWNLDKMDGTGASGRMYSSSYAQIHFLDMEWLGVGRVRYGIFQGGAAIYVHELSNTNALTSTYMTNPNQHVRFEVVNKAGSAVTASMKQICCSVMSEGGTQNLGIQRTVDNGATSIAPNNQHVAMLAIRQITASAAGGWGENSPRISPSNGSITMTGATDVRLTVQLNPVIANSASFTWTRVGLSSIEYATGSVTTLITTPGKVIEAGYLPGSTTPQSVGKSISGDIDPFFALGEDLYGNRDTLVLTVQELEGSANACYGTLAVKETL